ncbi:MAG: M50 family metallopeptidase [Candidatus Saccharimonadales bacterium]
MLAGILVGLLILTILVVVHEFGHAIVAIRNGVIVEEFGIGFPPTIFRKKLKNGINFSINLLPIGGFVKLQGENDSANKKGDYGAATFAQKTKILFAGVFANWLIAVVLLTSLSLFGLPKILPNQFFVPSDTVEMIQPVEIIDLNENYPAQKAGLKVGDKIVRFAGQEVPSVERLMEISKQNQGELIDVIYTRDGSEDRVEVQLLDDDQGALFGATLGQGVLMKSTWSSPIVGLVTSVQFTQATTQGIYESLSNLVSGLIMQLSFDANIRAQANDNLKLAGDSVAGPIGILGTIFPSAQKSGLTQLTLLVAIISISLAVFNILPIPALDGGRWFLSLIFKLSKKKLTKEIEEKTQAIGFSILVGLILLVTIVDVTRIL